MGAIGYAILLGFGGTLAAVIWTFVLGIAGAPGALLTAGVMRRTGATAIPTWGLLITAAGQLYVSLAFAAFVMQTTSSVLADSGGLGKWVAWLVTFFVATSPGFMALKDAARHEEKNVQHFAPTFTAPLTVVRFFVFFFAPSIREAAWG